MSRVALTLIIVIFLSSIISTPGSVARGEEKPLITVTAVPPMYAQYISLIGGNYVRVYSPIPPNVDPHTYEPTPDVINRAMNSDIVIVDVIGHLPIASKLVEMARERGVSYLIIYDELIKRGWRPLNKTSGTPDLHIEFDLNATLLFLDIVRDVLNSILKAKTSSDQALYERISIYLNSSVDTLKSIISNTYSYARDHVSRVRNVALYSYVSLYLARSIGVDPVYILLEEPEMEPTPGDINNLRLSGAKCILILQGIEEYSDRIISEIQSIGVTPAIVNIRETIIENTPYLAPVIVARELERVCSSAQETSARTSYSLYSDPIFIMLLAYSVVATIALAYLIYKRSVARR